MSKTLDLAKQLISIPSVTPNDNGCQLVMIKRLEKIDFVVNSLKFGEVDNFWAVHGVSSPVFVFAGHTDVVPVGDETQWHTKAFKPEIKNGLLYGRGTADMKGSLAAMIVATENFVKNYPNYKGQIGFLITSDEEGVAVDGTIKVLEYLKKKQQKIDYCLIGEPSSVNKLGDTIKNGRRGSLNAKLTIVGKQGHVAYPHLADNPIHNMLIVFNSLLNEVWDNGNKYFPKTSLQVSNIKAGFGVSNVIPSEAEAVFNFRYSSEYTSKKLKTKVLTILNSYNLNYKIEWQCSGEPFLTLSGVLLDACKSAVKSAVGIDSELSTSGGTSDGRFIVPMTKAQVVELGFLNSTIHKVNECVAIKDLDNLTDIYYKVLKNIFC